MNASIKKISLTIEHSQDTPIDYENLNTDVIVYFDNGDNYVAPFQSIKNLEEMIIENRQSEEHLSPQYYQILHTVLINNFNEDNLLPVIEHMIFEGDFQVVFRKI